MCDNDAPANPTYQALEKLKSDVNNDLPDVRSLLDSVAERMGDSTVWYGTQARDFSAELDGQKEKLGNRADDLPDDVQEQLNITPPTVDNEYGPQ
jgi:hypothetical protein